MKKILRILLSVAVVFLAVAVFAVKYWDYIANPWTRDGQVRAQVVQITPRVSAPITNLPIVDNQFVRKGDLLFEIDPSTYAAALAQAKANLDATRDQLLALDKTIESASAAVEQYEAQITATSANTTRTKAELVRTKTDLDRAAELVKKGDVSKRRYDVAVADHDSAISAQNNAIALVTEARAQKLKGIADLAKSKADRGAAGDQNAQLRAAEAAVDTAQLDLQFTQMYAPVDGYVTNLNLRLGSQAVANQPVLALVDINSFWVHGFFRETFVGDIRPGDRAVVTLMSYPEQPLTGRVDSIGWGIAQDDGSTGFNLLPNVNPTFEWIRLAQRVPVRIHLDDVPEGVWLRVGTTASVLVRTGTSEEQGTNPGVAAPRALQ